MGKVHQFLGSQSCNLKFYCHRAINVFVAASAHNIQREITNRKEAISGSRVAFTQKSPSLTIHLHFSRRNWRVLASVGPVFITTLTSLIKWVPEPSPRLGSQLNYLEYPFGDFGEAKKREGFMNGSNKSNLFLKPASFELFCWCRPCLCILWLDGGGKKFGFCSAEKIFFEPLYVIIW